MNSAFQKLRTGLPAGYNLRLLGIGLLVIIMIPNVVKTISLVGRAKVDGVSIIKETIHNHTCKDLPTRLQSNETISTETTAVIWATRFLDECDAARLNHLVATAGKQDHMGRRRDIWVLHNHHALGGPNDSRLERSKKLLTELHVNSTQQFLKSQFPIFDDVFGAGTSKSSSLSVIIQNNYSYVWILEDDAYYSGPWSDIFDLPIHGSVDVVAKFNPANHQWFQGKPPCFVNTSKNQSCEDVHPTAAFWPIIRMSNAFASALWTEMRHGRARGHHEAIVAAFCQSRGFRMEPFPTNRIGVYELGGGKGALSGDLGDLNPTLRRFYHPVKCVKHVTAQKMAYLLKYLLAEQSSETNPML